MKLVRLTNLALSAGALAVLGACSDSTAVTGSGSTRPNAAPSQSSNVNSESSNLRNGAVYTQTDAALSNTVVAYYRAPDGTLSPAGSFPTGGNGSGANLAGQGGVVLSGGSSAEVATGANQLLFVTNAGSNTLSVFRVEKNGIELVSTAPTNGSRPLSVTVHQKLVYVVNQGSGNITGFWVTAKGELTPIPGSTRSLTNPVGNPSQVAFSPDGRVLVTEGRESQIIDTYLVDQKTGLAEGPHANPTNGPEPFSFTFDHRDHLFMTEGHFAAPNAGTTSSYKILSTGQLEAISASVANLQSVPCWIVITDNEKFIYEANAISSTISSYTVNRDGSIVLRESIAGTAGSFPAPGAIDLAITPGSRFLYSLAGNGTIAAFEVNADGTLTPLGNQAMGFPPTVNGLASR